MFKKGQKVRFLGFKDDAGKTTPEKLTYRGKIGIITLVREIGRYPISIVLEEFWEDYVKNSLGEDGYIGNQWDVRHTEIEPVDFKLDLERYM